MVYQLGSAMMDAFVLSIVLQEDTYGYQISQQIKTIVDLKESTLYPVLRRLQESGYLDTYDQAYQGRNRRYYHITEKGKEQQEFYVREWQNYKIDVEKILLGGTRDE